MLQRDVHTRTCTQTFIAVLSITSELGCNQDVLQKVKKKNKLIRPDTIMEYYSMLIIKKAEHQVIDAFELWYWKRLLRVPWIAEI